MPAAKRALEIDSTVWLAKADAAKLLRSSVRQLERRAAQGLIGRRLLPKASHEKSARVVYSRDDIASLVENGAPAPTAQVELQTREKALEGQARVLPLAATLRLCEEVGIPEAEAIRLHREAVKSFVAPNASPPPALERCMSVAEAVEYSGLPAAYLIKAAKAGTIRAVNVGTGKREFWRFAREGAK